MDMTKKSHLANHCHYATEDMRQPLKHGNYADYVMHYLFIRLAFAPKS